MFKARRDAINAASKARKFGLILSTLGRQGSPKVLEVTREIVKVLYNPWSRTSQIPLSRFFDHHVSEWNNSSVYYYHFSVTFPGVLLYNYLLCRYVPLSSRVFIKHRGSENSPFTRLNSPANVWYWVYDLFLFRCGAFFKIFSCNVTPFSCY